MARHFLLFSFWVYISLISVPSVFAGDGNSRPAVALKVNLLPLPFGSINGFLEGRISRAGSIALGYNHWYSKKGALIFNGFNQLTQSLTMDYRFYFGKGGLNGFFADTYLKWRQIRQFDVVNYKEDSTGANSIAWPAQDQTWQQIGAGFCAGYQRVFRNGLVFEAFAGGGYYFSNTLKSGKIEWVTPNTRASRIDFRLGVGLGYSF